LFERTRRRSLRGRRLVILPGQYFDDETGLHYNYFRDYDPVTGRYAESDPIGLDGGLNPYLYANGNPLACIDPYGLWALSDPLPQGVVDFSAGLGDALLLDTGSYLRDLVGVDGGMDPCSAEYDYGAIAALAAGGGRVAYAGLAKAGSLLAASEAQASAFRAGLKTFFRGGNALEGQWTIPWGTLHTAESPSAAAVRETLEEGGVGSRIEDLLGIQETSFPLDGADRDSVSVPACKGKSQTGQPREGCGPVFFVSGYRVVSRAN
jgi:RHS repeat-associated protein